jgi:hypothetical protein
MKVSEYRSFFGNLGLKVSVDVGTPPEAHAEWADDFEILEGLTDFPSKRVAVLASK